MVFRSPIERQDGRKFEFFDLLDLRQQHHRVLWCTVLFGFFFFLRSSAYFRIRSKQHGYCLTWNDVWFPDRLGNRTGYRDASPVTISLRGTENDQYGGGSRQTMHRFGDPAIGLIRSLRHIQKSSPTRDNYSALTSNIDANEISKTKTWTPGTGISPPIVSVRRSNGPAQRQCE